MFNPKRTDMVLGAFVLAFTVSFFLPLYLFLTNKDVFFSSAFVMAGMLLTASMVIFILLTLLLFPIAHKRPVVALSLCAFLSFAIWVQAYVLNWDYGLLDGSPLRWHPYGLRTFADLFCWLGVLGMVLVLGVKRPQGLRTLLLALLFIQSANLVITWARTRDTHATSANGDQSISFQEQFTFSTRENIIVLMLDAYQSDIFNECLERDPDLASGLPGFTYYPNAIAEYHYTLPSVASLLTGKLLVKSDYANLREWRTQKTALLRNQSIPAVLKKEGYHVGIYPYYASNAYPPAVFGHIADNYVRSSVIFEDGSNEIADLMAVSLFRMAPHLLKKGIHEQWLLDASEEQDRDTFFRGMQGLGQDSMEAPVFRYYHLQGLHGPHVYQGERLNADLRESALIIADLVNEMMVAFVSKLQQAGVYDNSTIFIVADHGLYHDSASIAYGEFLEGQKARSDIHLDPFVKKCRALPLLLFKPPGATGPLQISRAPVSLIDIRPTVLEVAEVNMGDQSDGMALWEIEENIRRERRHFTSDVHRGRSVTPEYEFLIPDFAWHDHAWVYTGNVHTPGTIERSPLFNYRLGQKLSFGRFGTVSQYLVGPGWAPRESSHLVTGAEATIALPLESPARGMQLFLDLGPHNMDDISSEQRVALLVNGQKVETFVLSGKTTVSASLPFNPDWEATQTEVLQREPTQDTWGGFPEPPVLSEAVIELQVILVGDEADSLYQSAAIEAQSVLELFSLVIETPP